MFNPPAPAVIARLKSALDADEWSEAPEVLAPKLKEWRDRWTGATPLLIRPKTVGSVARVIAICAETGVAVTPQGGNTGLVGGQIPDGEILLSLERLRAIRDVDPLDDVIVAEAGVTLAEVQAAARDAGRRFPVSLASEGSATVGGLVSTNAGGVAVLRYGSMREQVLGLEAVFPDGSIWPGLRRLRKDNTGYDLKQLLIGAEGTLGVVTAASLRLQPALASRAVAMVGLDAAHRAVALLALAKTVTGGQVEAFELIQRSGLRLAVRNLPGARDPLSRAYPWYALIEIGGNGPETAGPKLEALLAEGLDTGLVADATIAGSERQAEALWALREGQSAAQKPRGPAWKHDVSVPVSRIPDFLTAAGAALEAAFDDIEIVAFGHIGDGNVHYDVLAREGADAARHVERREAAAAIVHDIVARFDGSISAEHGLGVMKTATALAYKSPVEVAAMRAVRKALDPRRIMNPRVLF